MAFEAYKLTNILPESHPFYFFDANIWIAILKNNQYDNAEKHYHPYIDFFESIVNLNTITDTKILKKVKNVPKIAFTSMLLSEIINAYLRNVAMPAFLRCKPGEGNFKKDYRENIYSDFDKQIKILVSDIQQFDFLLHIVDDSFSKIGIGNSLNLLDRKIDFNDLYYSLLMKELNIPIVTHDKDFKYDSISIITTNNILLQK
jgi:predicted nucleic acid-binding protein